MGRTRDLFKKIRAIKGTFYAKMGSIKDRNGMDLTEAEDIKKRWQEYTEELYKKDLHEPDNHDGVITHLEPDTLECEVKWALGSITMNKASGGDGIPVEQFQILKEDAVKMLCSICQQFGKLSIGQITHTYTSQKKFSDEFCLLSKPPWRSHIHTHHLLKVFRLISFPGLPPLQPHWPLCCSSNNLQFPQVPVL